MHILIIGQYVHAGMCALYALFPIFHLIAGILLILGSHNAKVTASANNCPPEFIGWIFVGIALTIILIGLAMASGMFLIGRFIAHRKRWLTCVILCGLECVLFPTGTVLGLFSLVVLTRPNVKRMFGVKLSQSEAALLELTEPSQALPDNPTEPKHQQE